MTIVSEILGKVEGLDVREVVHQRRRLSVRRKEIVAGGASGTCVPRDVNNNVLQKSGIQRFEEIQRQVSKESFNPNAFCNDKSKYL